MVRNGRITLRVPEIHHDLRWRYLRTRNIVRAQFQRWTWAQRCYRLAVKLDGRPDTYIRIRESDTLRVILPQPRFGPDVHHAQVNASDGGEITGGLTRDQLVSDDIPTSGFVVLDNGAKNWCLRSISLAGLASATQDARPEEG